MSMLSGAVGAAGFEFHIEIDLTTACLDDIFEKQTNVPFLGLLHPALQDGFDLLCTFGSNV